MVGILEEVLNMLIKDKIIDKYYRLKAELKVNVVWRIKAFLYFVWLGWLALRGKIAIMDDKVVESKVGYKYYDFWISKLPLSKKHTYKEF